MWYLILLILLIFWGQGLEEIKERTFLWQIFYINHYFNTFKVTKWKHLVKCECNFPKYELTILSECSDSLTDHFVMIFDTWNHMDRKWKLKGSVFCELASLLKEQFCFFPFYFLEVKNYHYCVNIDNFVPLIAICIH